MCVLAWCTHAGKWPSNVMQLLMVMRRTGQEMLIEERKSSL